jgi:hypothetical protein
MNREINFKLAELLKEKGFDYIDCQGYYHICDGYTKGYAYCYSDVNKQKEDAILAPIISEAVMWIYKEHGYWIVVDIDALDNWVYEISNTNIKRNAGIIIPHISSKTVEDAYEKAIEYCLIHLVK